MHRAEFRTFIGSTGRLSEMLIDIHAPILIVLVRGDKVYKARSLPWDEVPFEADLFVKPTGLTIEEAK